MNQYVILVILIILIIIIIYFYLMVNKKIPLVISCYYDKPNDKPLPIGFSWAKILTTLYPNKYNLTLLLHGQCIPYGLDKESNPYKKLLTELVNKHNVTIIICDYCLHLLGYSNQELLSFVKPIPFSVNYLASVPARIIYDESK